MRKASWTLSRNENHYGKYDDAEAWPRTGVFEMKGPEQSQPIRPSDYGLKHFAVYVDDIIKAACLFERADGKIFTSPQPLIFQTEVGENNFYCYGGTPWAVSLN